MSDPETTDSKTERLSTGLLALQEKENRAWSERIEFSFDLENATNGRYTYVRDIGAGGMGRVILARDEELEREVAVKILEVPAVTGNHTMVARFIREAKITASLVHPGIVPIYDLGHTEDGRHFFVMQVVEGVTLRELLARANMDELGRQSYVTHLIGLLIRVCQAVGYAHYKSIVHLDIKPSNIMEGAFGEVLVMDWGVAKRLDELDHKVSENVSDSEDSELKAEEKTPAHRIMGTPGFMAVEQYQADPKALGPHTDVFALGVILYEILVGQKPYTGQNPSEIRLAVTTGCRRAIKEAARHAGQKRVPNEIVAICDKALALQPNQRYQNALELADDLQAYMENRAIRAFQETACQRIRRWLRRHPAAAALLLGVAITALLTLSIWFSYYASFREYLHELKQQVDIPRNNYEELTRNAQWLQRQLLNIHGDDLQKRKELAQQLRALYTKRLLAAQHLRSTLAALLAAQRHNVDKDLSRQYRQLWLEEMELAMREGFVDYVQTSFDSMQLDRGKLPWWNWEPDEFTQVEEIHTWLRQQGTTKLNEHTSELDVEQE